MNMKTLTGTIVLAAALGIGVLAGSLLSPSASAGIPMTQVGQTAQATATAAPDTQKPALPGGGMPGHRGRGPGGPGGHGPGDGRGFGPSPGPDGGPGGRLGGAYTVDGATRAISATTSFITLVKGDLAYATGKMDTATVQDWVNKADALLTSAQTGMSAGEYGKAVETAHAARELAQAAELLMQQALGAETLPSFSQRQFPDGGHRGPGPGPGIGPSANITVTQAQASRVLAGLYNNITMQEALLNNSTSKGDAATYLAAAKAQYSKAYTAYQAGSYKEAAGAAHIGHELLEVVNALLRAGTAPNGPDTPVQVPPPFV
jgi:HEPN domain-containing protein